jgi:spore coat protein U-like protein
MRRLLAIASLMLLAPAAALAACTLAQPPNMNLGSYTGAESTSGSTTIRVTCTFASSNYTIGLNAGTGSGATTSNRKLTGPASATLNYGLFRDAAHTQNWGNTVGVDTAAGQGNVSTRDFTIHPRIAAGQLVAPGTYTDTVSTGSRTFTITAVVSAACAISANPLNFGIYVGVAVSATTTLLVTCTSTTPYYVNLDNGQHYLCCWYGRMIGPGGQLLTYSLWQDSAHTVPWWNTVNSDGKAGTGSGSQQSLTVYGLTLGNQNVSPGGYADTVVVKITY